jgi:epoxyqueuosine reductase
MGQDVNATRSLTDFIKLRAGELGFSKVGIARAEKLAGEGSRLREWLTRGYHGTMSWMGRNISKRVDVRELVPDAQSVVSLASNYFTPAEHSEGPNHGKVSRYAWGDDYHLVLIPRIRELVSCIKQERPGVNAAVYVDTGPVMDKAWAVRAGVGWLGKHTNVITREYGSWVFLGEIILNIELEYDAQMEDLCGTCAACIDACPTAAIVEPYVLDANRCISYLTIEHKGEIPNELKAHLQNWIFGCDICQDVCPWNRFEQTTEERAFAPRVGNVNPELEEIRTMKADEFSERFKGSAVKRTKLAGLIRNVDAVREGQRGG